MLPDRSVAPDKRVVHDQRIINSTTDKEWHPPAVQPKHEQVARLVLSAKSRVPGLEVLLSKKDVAGAFRLLWLDPNDAELFAGDLPWCSEAMESAEAEDTEGIDMTVIYLVSSFGFSGSPGEWTVWGKATEIFLRAHCPAIPRRDLSWSFDSRILVDDNVLVEPFVGLRPWVAAEVYEAGVKTLLGDAAINREKDVVEGQFRTFQTVWGLDIETVSEEVHLPERRILKGASLLSEACFDFGCKDVTLRSVQRFRGVATGWVVVVKGLRNELKAADVFLGTPGDGSAKVQPKVADPLDEDQIEKAWRDLWDLFEESRWLCARPETWPQKFGASMRELLPVRERLALPGEWDTGTVFVSSDATKRIIGAIDWTNGLVMRMPAKDAACWVQRCGDGEEVAIHVAEMLSFLAFACKVGDQWRGRVVLYGGDNQVVREWISSRKAGTPCGRLMVRMVNLLEMRYRFTLVPSWFRTFHNVHADMITRCSESDFDQLVQEKKWKLVDVRAALRQAAEDSERFGPCLLAWNDEDRQVLMQLKERRLRRSIPGAVHPRWSGIEAVELGGAERLVFDFVDAIHAAGGRPRTATWRGPVKNHEVVFASFPPDLHGKVCFHAASAAIAGRASLVVFEGPRSVPWSQLAELFTHHAWEVSVAEFLTTEFGEAAARRRVCLVASFHVRVDYALEATTSRGRLAPPAGALLRPAREVGQEHWIFPERTVLDAGIPREPLLPMLKGHFWIQGERFNLVSASGPIRWPLREGDGVQASVVHDPRGPAGAVRKLSDAEVWRCEGRTLAAWEALRDEGHHPTAVLIEGGKAAGGQTAQALVLMAGYLLSDHEAKAGSIDPWDDEGMDKLLRWLRRWKRGLLPRGRDPGHERRAGGHGGHERGGRGPGGVGDHDGQQVHKEVESPSAMRADNHEGCRLRVVWRWGESLWAPTSDGEEDDFECGTRAGGRKLSKERLTPSEALGRVAVGDTAPGASPFSMEVGALIDEWVDENLCGHLAESGKWKAWARRQGWISEFLLKDQRAEENEDKLLGFLGYLGWLGASPATMKQVVFALKEAHERAGYGDPTDRMFRLWMLLQAVERRTPRKARRLGVTPEMLQWIAKSLDNPEAGPEERFDAVMLLGALFTAWFFMLRAKEYSDSNGTDFGMVLRGVDVRFIKEGDQGGTVVGVTIQFRKTKTDQDAFGTCKTMYLSQVQGLCVVTALCEYKAVAPQRFGSGSEALKPLFRWANGQMLKRVQVQAALQKAAKAVGLPPERFLSHSLRIGGASAMFQATGEIELVKRTGRWSSSAVQRYLHDGEVALRNVASKMASVEQHVHYT